MSVSNRSSGSIAQLPGPIASIELTALSWARPIGPQREVHMSERTSWRGGLREAAVIVASILIAFAIDASWDGRVTRQIESGQVLAAREEVSTNLAQIEQRRTALQSRLEQADHFVRSSSTDLRDLSRDTIRRSLVGLYFTSTATLENSAITSLATAPHSPSAGAADARRLISKWLSQADYMEIRRTQAAGTSQAIEDFLATYAARQTREGVGGIPNMVSGVGPDVLAELRDDSQFVPMTIRMAAARREYVIALDRLTVTGDSLLASLVVR